MALNDQWAAAQFTITNQNGDKLHITASGRDLWALQNLIMAGPRGCTPFDNPAPRWSGYIHNLRNMGVEVETIHEMHGGEFAGTHGRYVLQSDVIPGQDGEGDDG